MTNPVMDIKGVDGPMRVVFIRGDKPLIQFYDTRFDPGQRISEYYLSTLLESDRSAGINLYSGVPSWKIGPVTTNLVLDWASYHS